MTNIATNFRRMCLYGIFGLWALMVAAGCSQESGSEDATTTLGLAAVLANIAADANACKFNEGKFNVDTCRFRVSPF